MAKNTECSIWMVLIQKSQAFCLFSWCQAIFPFHFHGTNSEVLRNVQNQSIPYGTPYTQILHILPTTTNIISISEGVSFFDFLIFFSSFFIESNMIFFFIFETNPSSISFYILLEVRYKKNVLLQSLGDCLILLHTIVVYHFYFFAFRSTLLLQNCFKLENIN